MTHFIGLDPHAATCTLAVVTAKGKRRADMVVETSGDSLVAAICSVSRPRKLCIEEGELSSWLYELLAPYVDDIVVGCPSYQRGAKNDSLDAFGWAERYRLDGIDKRVFKAPERFARLRELARVYAMMVRDVTRSKLQLKSLYRSRGVMVTGDAVYSATRRAEHVAQLPASARDAAQLLHDAVEEHSARHGSAQRMLIGEARRHPIFGVLTTCPGLGEVRVSQLMATVITPHRFRSKRTFWSYCGLGIVMRTSSDWSRKGGQLERKPVRQTRGLNPACNHQLKNVFKGAATTVIGQRTVTPYSLAYHRLVDAGTRPNLAKLTVARKIAATVLRMWKDEEVYDPKR